MERKEDTFEDLAIAKSSVTRILRFSSAHFMTSMNRRYTSDFSGASSFLISTCTTSLGCVLMLPENTSPVKPSMLMSSPSL